MSKKFEIFGKTFNEPRSISGLSGAPPSPIGGIPPGAFAIFAVLILSFSLASYLPEEEAPQSEMPLTEAQSTYLENILSDRSRSSATLATYDTCGFLEMDLKEHLKELFKKPVSASQELCITSLCSLHSENGHSQVHTSIYIYI